MFSICGSSNAAGKDEIITCSFSFDMQSPGGKPDERIKPMQGTGNLGQELNERVAALDVRKFVQQD